MTGREEDDKYTNETLLALYKVDPVKGRAYLTQITEARNKRDNRDLLIGIVIALAISLAIVVLLIWVG